MQSSSPIAYNTATRRFRQCLFIRGRPGVEGVGSIEEVQHREDAHLMLTTSMLYFLQCSRTALCQTEGPAVYEKKTYATGRSRWRRLT